MHILTIRTDNPEAEVGLFDDARQVAYESWHAHRELASTLHQKIDNLLTAHSMTLQDIGGIVCFQGPGSFTGLRIGLSVANALAYALEVPIVGIMGDDWAAEGVKKLQAGVSDRIVNPHYGAPVHITQPRTT